MQGERTVKGYKVFNHDWSCRHFQYKVGKSYEMDVEPIICDRGFHFCQKLENCFEYYIFDPKSKVAEVEAYGDVISKDGKSCTNKIKIVREIPWDEVLRIVNTGHCNTGDYNGGDYNTGDYNCISCSSGCFNTIEEKIIMFNKASDWTIKDWWASKARRILDGMPKKAIRWIRWSEMTDEEKSGNPDCEAEGGYLKILDKLGNVQAWWDNLHDYEKKEILALPNFNAGIFEKCTGIKVQDGQASMNQE